ncbi:CoA-binding protein [Luteimonas aquatica]|uniref:CoA-binding protein n=1 Tax=Luteimonas aquatica TaxID=450364 RepID=UPI001F573EF3|nr:CoA-binding protein [Luteimonas aquatica]
MFKCGRVLSGHRDFDRVFGALRRIAVLGIKPEHRADRPAHIVPSYLRRVGYEILPVPVYYPEVERIFDRPVYRSVAEIPGRVDLVDVFRKPEDLEAHLPDLIKARPRTVWMQTGIRNEVFVERLVAAGIDVVQDECLMVEDRRWRSTR